QGRDCPDWVPGELWIGGIGVAEGYFNDPLRSEQQFLTLPDERWYRTGDLGCYWPDGTIEFLGRRDKQVKVGGYRIELGEIESALSQLAGVKQATVLAIGEKEK
ncbi:AMP-binding protein, partial [Escherichia coli]|nr:AMP-binding protein [Escherichia coli]